MSFKKIDWKNLLERALWTFVEGFLLAIPIIAPSNIESFMNDSWKMILAGALGAGISAVKTFILDAIKQYKDQNEALGQASEIEEDEYGDLTEFFEKQKKEEGEEDK